MAKKEKRFTVLKSEGIEVTSCFNQYLWIGSTTWSTEREIKRFPLVLDTPTKLRKLIRAAQAILKAQQGTPPK